MGLWYCRREDVVARQIAGDWLLVPIRSDLAGMQCLFVLDSPVAEHIWRALEGATSSEALCEGVVASFDVSPEQAERDVGEFLSELLAAGLIAEGGQ